jgi:hypothetical protein
MLPPRQRHALPDSELSMPKIAWRVCIVGTYPNRLSRNRPRAMLSTTALPTEGRNIPEMTHPISSNRPPGDST